MLNCRSLTAMLPLKECERPVSPVIVIVFEMVPVYCVDDEAIDEDDSED